MAVPHATSATQAFPQAKVLWASVAQSECSYSDFNQLFSWQSIHDTNEKMCQLTQGVVEK